PKWPVSWRFRPNLNRGMRSSHYRMRGRMRMGKGISVLTTAAVVAVLGTAALAAEKYGDLTAKSTPLASANDVAGLFWSTTVDCGKAGNDLERRQCEGIKIARADQAANGQYVVSGDG